jgi:hypothetical protein
MTAALMGQTVAARIVRAKNAFFATRACMFIVLCPDWVECRNRCGFFGWETEVLIKFDQIKQAGRFVAA